LIDEDLANKEKETEKGEGRWRDEIVLPARVWKGGNRRLEKSVRDFSMSKMEGAHVEKKKYVL